MPSILRKFPDRRGGVSCTMTSGAKKPLALGSIHIRSWMAMEGHRISKSQPNLRKYQASILARCMLADIAGWYALTTMRTRLPVWVLTGTRAEAFFHQLNEFGFLPFPAVSLMGSSQSCCHRSFEFGRRRQ